MKASEIIIGNEYAIERFGGSYYRARVVAIGAVEGESRGTGRYGLTRGHATTTKRATVLFVRADGTEYDSPETVVLSKVAMPWADHVKAMARRRQGDATVDEHLSAIEARCHALLGADHVIYFSRRNTNYQSVGNATVSASTMTKLLDAAYAAGRASGLNTASVMS